MLETAALSRSSQMATENRASSRPRLAVTGKHHPACGHNCSPHPAFCTLGDTKPRPDAADTAQGPRSNSWRKGWKRMPEARGDRRGLEGHQTIRGCGLRGTRPPPQGLGTSVHRARQAPGEPADRWACRGHTLDTQAFTGLHGGEHAMAHTCRDTRHRRAQGHSCPSRVPAMNPSCPS